MRAAKKNIKDSKIKIIESEHISGAEGIYNENEICKKAVEYIKRALHHPKGRADEIVLTIEQITDKPQSITSLPVITLKTESFDEVKRAIILLLNNAGVSDVSISNAFTLLDSGCVMRGASLMSAVSGKRFEPDMQRGIRVSRLGISREAGVSLSQRLSRHRINTSTVREAIILASKVASCRDIIAELCISDDPDYTTGYVASRKYGYVRILNIKRKGEKKGGRIFFLRDSADIDSVISYLEKKPVIISSISVCRGLTDLNEVLDRNYKQS